MIRCSVINNDLVSFTILCCIVEETKSEEFPTDSWEIQEESLQLTAKLSEGIFSEVWTGIWNSTSKITVTITKADALSTPEIVEVVENLRNLRHTHIVQVCKKVFKKS